MSGFSKLAATLGSGGSPPAPPADGPSKASSGGGFAALGRIVKNTPPTRSPTSSAPSLRGFAALGAQIGGDSAPSAPLQGFAALGATLKASAPVAAPGVDAANEGPASQRPASLRARAAPEAETAAAERRPLAEGIRDAEETLLRELTVDARARDGLVRPPQPAPGAPPSARAPSARAEPAAVGAPVERAPSVRAPSARPPTATPAPPTAALAIGSATDMGVAHEILRQLGGQRFVTMTGATNLVGSKDALSFRLPLNFAKNGINGVRIKLDATDTYTVQFLKVGRAPEHRLTVVDAIDSIYADTLAEVFRSHTGLETRMPEVRVGRAATVQPPAREPDHGAQPSRVGPSPSSTAATPGAAVTSLRGAQRVSEPTQAEGSTPAPRGRETITGDREKVVPGPSGGALRDRITAYLTAHPAQQATVLMRDLGGTDPDKKSRVLSALQAMRQEGVVVRENKDDRHLWSLTRTAVPAVASKPTTAQAAPAVKAAPGERHPMAAVPAVASPRVVPVDTAQVDEGWETPVTVAAKAEPAESEAEPAPQSEMRVLSVREPPSLSTPKASPSPLDMPVVGHAEISTANGRRTVAVLARDADLFVHATREKPTRLAVSEVLTGLKIGTFDTIEEARAAMWAVNSPEIRPLLEQAFRGVSFKTRGRKKGLPVLTEAAQQSANEVITRLAEGESTRLARYQAALHAGYPPAAPAVRVPSPKPAVRIPSPKPAPIAQLVKLDRLSEEQLSALGVYVFDPAHNGDDGSLPFPGRMEGKTLVVDDVSDGIEWLIEAANSADADADVVLRSALETITERLQHVRRAIVEAKTSDPTLLDEMEPRFGLPADDPKKATLARLARGVLGIDEAGATAPGRGSAPVSVPSLEDRVLAATLEQPRASAELAAHLGADIGAIRKVVVNLHDGRRLNLLPAQGGSPERWVNAAIDAAKPAPSPAAATPVPPHGQPAGRPERVREALGTTLARSFARDANETKAEEGEPSSRTLARRYAAHDAEVMVRMMGPGVVAHVGGVTMRATPDWRPQGQEPAPRPTTAALRALATRADAASARIIELLGQIGEAGGVAIFREVTDPVAPRVLADLVKDGAVVATPFGESVLYSLPRASPSVRAQQPPARSERADASLVDDEISPVEHRTAAARRDANLKAMVLAAELEARPRALTDADRLTLAAYSDWGGIGIQKAQAKFPPGFPVPEARQLIHAYFTPPRVCAEIARVVRPLLPGLVATDGRVHALEPAVGIGRFPLALSGPGFETVTWHCVEFSLLSYKMLHALRPDMDLYQGPFERWVAERGADFAGRLKLVISNPPYGQRSYATTDDPDRSYRYKRADDYFLRRGLDLLGAGGLGVYIIPSGFLTGMSKGAVELRKEVLRRHHLSAAFRLPNEVFSLANVVTDILFFRARGGEPLPAVDAADTFILEGRYYEEFPAHILGKVVQNDPSKARGWHTSAEGYTVVGEFTELPPLLEERPMCSACLHSPVPQPVQPPKATRSLTTTATAAEQIVDDDERMAAAASLGRRVESFLSSVANPDLEPVGWAELHDDLTQWAAMNGAPAMDQAVLALAKAERGALGHGPPGGAGWLLKAFLGTSMTLIEPLAEKPRWMPRFLGNPNDPLQVGEHLYRSRKTLAIHELPGQDPSALFAAGWCEDSTAPAWIERLDARGQLLPPDEYLFGELWPRFDRAQARAVLGDAQAAAQATRLIEIIKPATFDEIEVTPQDGFLPLELLAGWLATVNHNDPVDLVRDKGLVRPANVAFEDLDKHLGSLSTEALWIVGWVNHDYVTFQPSAGEGEKVDDVRLALAKEWTQRFRAWLESAPLRQRIVEKSYQRARQGYRAHGYGSEPLKLARWNPAIVLNPHQIAGARRVDANHGGGLGFDVGVGKTFTILAALALARQAGRARRAVLVVPQPIAFQWVANIGKALPGFRVVVIGINKKTIATGLRKGLETSETDSPEERSRKWARFQGGEFDVAILTYDALPRTQMDQASTLKFIEGVTAIEREVEIRKRNAAKAAKGKLAKYEEDKGKLDRKLAKLEKKLAGLESQRQHGHWIGKKGDDHRELIAAAQAQRAALEKKHLGSLTERQDAILTEGVGAWLAEMLELPQGWKHDPDIVWNTIGVDWMGIDEAHNGKNLHMPSSREGGSVPKFMGNEGEGSKRAWHWFFRCCDVQSRGGEVVLATATPASNSPLEFYNLVKLMDKDAWGRIGIYDPEAFIDRFCLLEPQEVLNAEMETETRLACVGFKNLDELRSVIFKFWEFKTAKQAHLKLPVAKVERVFVNMDTAQEKKYATYIAQIEDALSKPKELGGNTILGLLAKMAMVAMHAQLDEKFDWNTARGVDSPHSPKFDALAQKILAQRGCGHIVFADYIAAHAWLRDVLIEAGIPAGRIGVLNAVVAPNAADRQRIARDFNGDAQAGIASKYDVLIANAIGEEGVDLQDKTCAIHHLDIGWTPKKTEQRNGRGVRQGNTLSNINIFYYIANRSQDGTRLDMVRGKQNWISSLLEGEDKDTNNPAAQSNLSRKELLVLISRDPEKTRARLEAAEAEREDERKAKLAKGATDTLRAVANRFQRARTERDPTIAAELISVAKQKLAGLAKVPPDIWPWAGWATAADQFPMLVPKEGGPVYETLRVAMPRVLDRSVIEYAEFGRVDEASIGSRVAGAAHWEQVPLDKVVQLRLEPQMRVAEGTGPSWPTNDQVGVDAAMKEKWLLRFRQGPGASAAWTDLGWTRAPEGFVEEQWSRWGDEIVRAMASTGGWAAKLQVPAIRGVQLVLGLTPPYNSVIPPTSAGWQRFLELARLSGEKFTVLEDAGLWWFGRGIPRNLLAVAREADPAPKSRAA